MFWLFDTRALYPLCKRSCQATRTMIATTLALLLLLLSVFFPMAWSFLPGGSIHFISPRMATTPHRGSPIPGFQLEASPKCSSPTKNQEWDVNLYQKHSFIFEYGSSLVDILDPQPGERILDIGCGSGQLTQEIAERGATVIGIDADANMIARAQTDYPNIQFVQGNVVHLDATTAVASPVDAIFSNAALHWIKGTKNVEMAVSSMSNVLRPNGRFVVEFGGKGNVQQIVAASLSVLSEHYGNNHHDDDENDNDEKDKLNPWYFPSIAEYSGVLEKHGIEVVSASLYDRLTPLEDGENGMANWLRMFGSGTLLQSVPDDATKEAIIAQIVSKLKTSKSKSNNKNHLYQNGQWMADYRRIRIVGRKK